jgi:hypothetical protein
LSSASAYSSSGALALALMATTCGAGHPGGTLIDRGGVSPSDDASAALPDDADAAAGTGDAPAPPCTWVLPRACPPTVPSFAMDIAPLIARRCRPACHEPGGVSEAQTLTTYAQVFAKRGTVLTQFLYCKMPPPPVPALPPEEGAQLLDWLICGSPNN